MNNLLFYSRPAPALLRSRTSRISLLRPLKKRKGLRFPRAHEEVFASFVRGDDARDLPVSAEFSLGRRRAQPTQSIKSCLHKVNSTLLRLTPRTRRRPKRWLVGWTPCRDAEARGLPGRGTVLMVLAAAAPNSTRSLHTLKALSVAPPAGISHTYPAAERPLSPSTYMVSSAIDSTASHMMSG